MKRKVRPLSWFKENCQTLGKGYFISEGRYGLCDAMVKYIGKKIEIIDDNYFFDDWFFEEWMLEPIEPEKTLITDQMIDDIISCSGIPYAYFKNVMELGKKGLIEKGYDVELKTKLEKARDYSLDNYYIGLLSGSSLVQEKIRLYEEAIKEMEDKK